MIENERKSESRKSFEAGKFATQGLAAGMGAKPNPQILDIIKKITEEANKMENKKIYNDDVERIVNEPERQSAIKKRNIKRRAWKKKKMLVNAVVFASVGLIFGLFGCFGWLAPVISIMICGVSGFCSAFLFGRWFENGKCWGWH